MRKSVACSAALLLGLAVCGSYEAIAAEPLRLYVSTAAGAVQDGSAEHPFATLAAARDAIRARVAAGGASAEAVTAGGAIVEVAPGLYRVQDSLELGKEDSGRPEAPIIYRGGAGGAVRLSGGLAVPLSSFGPVSDGRVLERLPQQVRQSVLQVDLRALGIDVQFDPMPLSGHSMDYVENVTGYRRGPSAIELFQGGQALPVARWPDDGYASVAEVVQLGSVTRSWQKDIIGKAPAFSKDGYVEPEKRENPPLGFAFRIEDAARAQRWKSAGDAMLFGYWFYNWSDQTVEVAGVDEDGTIRSVQPSAYGITAGKPFYIYNLLEELDQPGEWYLDRRAGILYLLPLPGAAEGDTVEISLTSEPLVRLKGASYVVFENLVFETSRGSGIEVRQGRDVRIRGSEFRQLGGRAVLIEGGSNHVVSNCRITATGRGGIVLSGGDRKTLRGTAHRAEHNVISNYARLERTYTAAVDLRGVGNSAVGNRIFDGPHVGIRFAGNDHLIEGNDISRVCLEADDMGAIYGGRDVSARGTVIRYNYIHDIPFPEGMSKPLGRHGVYLDDQLCGTLIEKNVFNNIAGLVVLINGGRDNTVVDNMFVTSADLSARCRILARFAAVGISNIGMDGRRHSVGPEGLPPIADPAFLSSVAYAKYPNFAGMQDDQPSRPKHNRVEGNVAIGMPFFFFHHFPRTELKLSELLKDNTVTGNTEVEPGLPVAGKR